MALQGEQKVVPRVGIAPPQFGTRSVRAVSAGDTQIMTGTVGKRIFVVAGTNGAGKTTFATEFPPNVPSLFDEGSRE